jgi:acetyl-CoA synthetase (ADP-forming)
MKIDKPRDYVVKNLHYAFHPGSIAVVGASDNPGKVGFQVIHGLRRYRYPGRIYPVNDHANRIQGLKAYRELKDIPEPIDLLFVAVRYDKVKSVLEQAVEKQVRVVAVSTSDFKETGHGELQDELTHFCRDHKLPLLGPNLLGLGNPHFSFNCGFTSFPRHIRRCGRVSTSICAPICHVPSRGTPRAPYHLAGREMPAGATYRLWSIQQMRFGQPAWDGPR